MSKVSLLTKQLNKVIEVVDVKIIDKVAVTSDEQFKIEGKRGDDYAY